MMMIGAVPHHQQQPMVYWNCGRQQLYVPGGGYVQRQYPVPAPPRSCVPHALTMSQLADIVESRAPVKGRGLTMRQLYLLENAFANIVEANRAKLDWGMSYDEWMKKRCAEEVCVDWRRMMRLVEERLMPSTTSMEAASVYLNIKKACFRLLMDVEGSDGCLQVVWKKPESGWVKVNCDGASLGNPGLSGFGGLCRDENGKMLFQFYGGLGIANSYHAEMEAIRWALSLAWSRGYRKVVIESDCERAVRNVLNHNIKDDGMVNNIRRMMDQDWECKLRFAYREANWCADLLAGKGAHMEKEHMRVDGNDRCTEDMDMLLLADVMEVPCFRKSKKRF